MLLAVFKASGATAATMFDLRMFLGQRPEIQAGIFGLDGNVVTSASGFSPFDFSQTRGFPTSLMSPFDRYCLSAGKTLTRFSKSFVPIVPR